MSKKDDDAQWAALFRQLLHDDGGAIYVRDGTLTVDAYCPVDPAQQEFLREHGVTMTERLT